MSHDTTRWIGVADSDALSEVAYRRVLDCAECAIKQRSQFLIVLAGGNTPLRVYRMLRDADTDWSRWHVYFGDERCLPAEHAERNSTMAGDVWLNHVPIPQKQVHLIRAELGPDAAALAYAETLRGVDDFDLVLLGLGEDGHTASLFPNYDCGSAPGSADVVTVFDAPKPPAQRVSLSAARLSRTRAALFMVAGTSKRSAVRRWRSGEPLPAAAIRPAGGVDILVESALLD